jgi:hypothetical protein
MWRKQLSVEVGSKELRKVKLCFDIPLLAVSCYTDTTKKKITKLNSVAVDRKRTILIERPPLVGEVSANLCG